MLPKDKSFIIIVFHNKQKIRLTCEMVGLGLFKHSYLVTARNKTLVFENNRPAMEKAGLGHLPYSWTLVRGELNNQFVLADIITALEAHIRGKGKPPLYAV